MGMFSLPAAGTKGRLPCHAIFHIDTFMARLAVRVGVYGACMNIHAFGCGGVGVGGAKVGKRRVLSLSASLPHLRAITR